MLKGKELFDDVRQCSLPCAFWWLGQASYVVKMGKTVALIDPFLMPMKERRVPPLFAARDAAGIVDFVLCTHDHIDHIDPDAVTPLARETGAVFLAPRAHEARMKFLEVPAERLRLIDHGETVMLGQWNVSAVKAAHEFFDETPEGLFPHLGYVVEGAGKTVYHSGDTVWWEGLQGYLWRWAFDAMLLPINGRDARRLRADCIGNMVYQEAADLAGGLDVKLMVPMHYDMFEFNQEDPQAFVDYYSFKYPGRETWVGEPTECVPF